MGKEQIIEDKIQQWLHESISNFSKEICPIDIAFIVNINECKSLILVFNDLPESFEDIIYDKFIESLEHFYSKRNLKDEGWQFSIRMFDKKLFLYNISKFDPDVLQYFFNEAHLLIGQEHYNSIADQFIKKNLTPKPDSIILTYFEDVLSAWSDAHTKYISLDIQLSRCILNALKLYYTLTETPINLSLNNITSLIDAKTLEGVITKIDFIIDKSEIGFSKQVLISNLFEEDNHNILEKQIIVEEFLQQFFDWFFSWIETNFVDERAMFFSMIIEKLKKFFENSNLIDKYKSNLLKVEKKLGKN